MAHKDSNQSNQKPVKSPLALPGIIAMVLGMICAMIGAFTGLVPVLIFAAVLFAGGGAALVWELIAVYFRRRDFARKENDEEKKTW